MDIFVSKIGILAHLAWWAFSVAPLVTLIVGTPFRSVPYRYDPSERGAVLQTSRFVVVFEGLKFGGGGSGGGMTVSGRHGITSFRWDGYASGEHAGTEQQILPGGKLGPPVRRVYLRHDYDPARGRAILEFYGHRLVVHSEARKLHIKGEPRVAPPGTERAVLEKIEQIVEASDGPQ
jgi:hypothetical protein